MIHSVNGFIEHLPGTDTMLGAREYKAIPSLRRLGSTHWLFIHSFVAQITIELI